VDHQLYRARKQTIDRQASPHGVVNDQGKLAKGKEDKGQDDLH